MTFVSSANPILELEGEGIAASVNNVPEREGDERKDPNDRARGIKEGIGGLIGQAKAMPRGPKNKIWRSS